MYLQMEIVVHMMNFNQLIQVNVDQVVDQLQEYVVIVDLGVIVIILVGALFLNVPLANKT
jgi:hypothetical protein